MEKDPIIELEECPVCRGAGYILHEGGWSVQVECADCSAHTVLLSMPARRRSGRPNGGSRCCGIWAK